MPQKQSKHKMKKFNLDDREKREPYEAPDGYFEELPLRVRQKIETIPDSGRTSFSTDTVRWSIAAAVALLLLSGLFWWNLSEQHNPDPLAGIATAELVNFLEVEYQMEPMNTEEWAMVLENTPIEDSLWNAYESEVSPANELTDEELQQLYEQLNNTEDIL